MLQADTEPKQSALSRKSSAPISSANQERRSSSLNLLRAIGNQSFGRMIQAKLTVNKPRDIYEQEADRVAEQVMRMTAPAPVSLSSGNDLLRRKCESCSEEDEKKKEEEVHGEVSRKESGGTAALGETVAPPIVQQGRAVPLHSGPDSSHVPTTLQQGARASSNLAGFVRGIVQRQEVPPPPPATNITTVTPEKQVIQWLELHQFAPPEVQPEEGEHHVLLNGEDMTISEGVKLAAAELQLAPEVVNNVITAQLALPIAKSVAGAPYISANNQIPGINLGGQHDAFGVNIPLGKTVELSTIDDFLTEHGFATPEVRDPTATRVLFDGKETTVDDVAARAFAILGQYPLLKKADVVAHIRQKYVAARGGAGNQIVFGYTLVPKLAQYVSGPADPLNPLRTQHQFSFTITRQHHANDSPGLETSFQGSVTLTDQGILNVQAGAQEAVVKPLLEGWLQVSGLVQLMASENWSKTVSGTTVVTPAAQLVAGAQILVTPTFRAGDYKFLNGHVQFGLQVLAGGQYSSSGVSGVANVGLVLNIPFSL